MERMAPKSLCLTTALAPVPAFLGGSCPWGCSLRRPCRRGSSLLDSPSPNLYAAGSEKEKRAGCPLHGATIAQSFVFCNRGCGRGSPWTGGLVAASALLQRRVRLGLRRYPARSTLQRFPETGGLPCTPGGGCAPCTLLGERRRHRLLTSASGRFLTCLRRDKRRGPWRAPLSHLAHPPAFLGTGILAVRPAHPAWGTRRERRFLVVGASGRFLAFARRRGQGKRPQPSLGRQRRDGSLLDGRRPTASLLWLPTCPAG